jgi:hypothetical protein
LATTVCQGSVRESHLDGRIHFRVGAWIFWVEIVPGAQMLHGASLRVFSQRQRLVVLPAVWSANCVLHLEMDLAAIARSVSRREQLDSSGGRVEDLSEVRFAVREGHNAIRYPGKDCQYHGGSPMCHSTDSLPLTFADFRALRCSPTVAVQTMPLCAKLIEYIRLPIGGTSRSQLSAMWAYTPSSDSGGHCGRKKAGIRYSIPAACGIQ